MKHRFTIAALAALGLLTANCRAQSAPADSPASSVSSNPAIGDAAGKDSCGGDLDSKRKVGCFAHRSLNIGTFVGPLFMAVPELAKPPDRYPAEWRKGPAALGRLYGDALALQTVQQTTRFLAGLALHEDLRYYAAADANPLRRVLHALAFTVFDRSDSGRTTLAASNILGSAAAGFVGNAYLPRGYDDATHALTRMEFQFGFIAAANLVSEFRPELRRLQRAVHLPWHGQPAVTRGD